MKKSIFTLLFTTSNYTRKFDMKTKHLIHIFGTAMMLVLFATLLIACPDIVTLEEILDGDILVERKIEVETIVSKVPEVKEETIQFLKADNTELASDLLVPFDIGTTTNYVIYLDHTSTELPSLALKMHMSSPSNISYSVHPDPTETVLDYSIPQTFEVIRTVDGAASAPVNISVVLFRKPIAVESVKNAKDVITMDFDIISDSLEDAVFAMYPTSIEVSDPADVLEASMKLRRNLGGIETNEYLMMDRAGSVLGGSLVDEEMMLSPNTEYSLYFAYEFSNGAQLVSLGTYSTKDISIVGTAGPYLSVAGRGSGTNTSIRPTEELFKVAFIVNNFDMFSAIRRFSVGSNIVIDNGVVTTAGAGYRERMQRISGTSYSIVIIDNKRMTAEEKESINVLGGGISLRYGFTEIYTDVFVNDIP